MDHPENFTNEEWEEYLNKLVNILPFNDKEWQEFLKLLEFGLGERNPNGKFYDYSRLSEMVYKKFIKKIKKETPLDFLDPLKLEVKEMLSALHYKSPKLNKKNKKVKRHEKKKQEKKRYENKRC